MRFINTMDIYCELYLKWMAAYPIDHTSHGCDQPNSKITSGAL